MTAAAVVAAIVESEPFYRAAGWTQIDLDIEQGERAFVAEWLSRVLLLLRDEGTGSRPVLDGREVVASLIQLDEELRSRLVRSNFFAQMAEEIASPGSRTSRSSAAEDPSPAPLNGPVTTLSVSPDGELLAVATRRAIRVTSLRAGFDRADLEVELELAGAVFLDEQTVLAVADDGTSWFVKDGVRRSTSIGPPVGALLSLGQGQAIAVGADGTISLFAHGEWRVLATGVAPASSLAVAPRSEAQDTRLLATGHAEGAINVWELHAEDATRRGVTPELQMVATIGGPRGNVVALDFASGGRLAAAAEDGSVHIFDQEAFNRERFVAGSSFWLGSGVLTCLAADPSGRRLAVGDIMGEVQILSAEDGSGVAAPLRHAPGVTALTWTPDGRSLVIGGADGRTTVHDLGIPSHSAHVDWVHDEPAEHDVLKRRPLAALIAGQLRDLESRYPGRSFLVHVDGPWGSGKSSLLNFLDDQLRKDHDDPWLVARFDAWRQSKVGPPWLALISTVREALRQDRKPLRRVLFRVREWARLAGSGHWLAVALFIVVAGLLTFFALNFSWDDATTPQTVIALITGVAGVATLVWSTLKGTTGLMIRSSSKRAREFEESQRDPMDDIARHFAWLLDRAGKTMVVFIDDLDRCRDTYVVELLDTLQTLMRTAPKVSGKRSQVRPRDAAPVETNEPGLIFVVAADGRWIRKSYEEAHKVFIESVAEPGRPLGYLFLEKLFQVTVDLPSLSPALQREYLSGLLTVPDPAAQDTTERRHETLRQQINESETEHDVLRVLEAATPSERVHLSDDVISVLRSAPARQATEHALQKFAPLLDANPRSMKRFVISYSIARGVRTVEGSVVGVEPLALWMVVRSRWPALADYITAHPESIDLVGSDNEAITAKGVPTELVPLFEDSDHSIREVVEFLHGKRLTPAEIRECCGIGDRQEGALLEPS